MNAEQILLDTLTKYGVQNSLEVVGEFKRRVTGQLSQLDGKFAGYVWRRRNGKVEEQFVIFVPRDVWLPNVLEAYSELCKDGGCGEEQVESVERLRARVEVWQQENAPCLKLPDAERGECP